MVKGLLERQIRGGPLFTVVRQGQEIGQESGWKNSGEKTITFRPRVDVREGDWLSTLDGAEHYVLDTEPINDVRPSVTGPIGFKVRYMTRREYDREESSSIPAPPSITFGGDFHGNPNINTGTQRDVRISGDHTFDFRSIEQEVARSGAPESDEMLEAIRELRAHLEDGRPLRPGMLARISEAMQKNTWVSGHLGRALVDWLTTLPPA